MARTRHSFNSPTDRVRPTRRNGPSRRAVRQALQSTHDFDVVENEVL